MSGSRRELETSMGSWWSALSIISQIRQPLPVHAKHLQRHRGRMEQVEKTPEEDDNHISLQER